MKPRVHLIVERPDGYRSEAEVEGAKVTSVMLDSAEDLLHTLTTGERPIIKNLYDLVARAFGTTREEAKTRLTAAAYGGSPPRSTVSPHDQRRLRDGARALALPVPQDSNEVRAQLEVVDAGMRALQSLDDLGEEGNRRAHEDLRELEKRYAALHALQKLLKK